MLRLTQSNRLETLAARLATALDRPAVDPLVPEIVVVPNGGMARWLSLAIARAHGVCANVRFELPAAFVWDVIGRVVGPRAALDVFDPSVLAWQVFDVLGRLEASPRFATLHAYVDGDGDRPRWELARRIAGVFDQYLVYRPDWIRRWEAGEGEEWQPELWRRLVAARAEPHRVRRLDALVAALAEGSIEGAALPDRVFVFGVPVMPPAWVAVLGHLAARIDVDAYLLSPSPEYWRELVTEREIAGRTRTIDAERAHLETGNPLLVGLGRQGAEFQDLMAEWDPHTIDDFVAPDETTLLGTVQADIHATRDRGSLAGGAGAHADDGTIQVHACHGPMREVEILYDQLLGLFDRHPDLGPSDVVVMMPDVEAYAPCIDAVFATAPRERAIPYSIADRSLRAERPLVAAFLALLELPASRYDANRLLALLEVEAVRRRFGFTPTDAARARRWVREVGIRWGVDAAARADLGLPATGEHTWRFGLDRLLLGHAMMGEGRHRFAGVLPYDDVEGTAARAAGLLSTFARACADLRGLLGARRPPAAWAGALGSVLDRFFAGDREDEEDLVTIRRALVDLVGTTSRAGFAGAISLDVVRAHLGASLEAPVATGRFLAGRVTFCALVPMRSIPFPIVCLLGMNDGSVPRPRRPLGFDLMAEDFRPGDRSRREDDRYLFLEAILSARRVLYVSYAGFDVRDNGQRPPSVLVADLVEYVERGLGVGVVHAHPLQPFDARYFEGHDVLFSHADDLCRARRGQGSRSEVAAPFVVGPLSAPDDAWRTIAVDELVRFFQGPARFFLRERLGIRLEPARGEVETREPFVLDALERYRVRDELVRLWRARVPRAELGALVRAAGLLPHGVVGDVALEGERADVESLVARLEAVLPGAPVPPVRVDVALDGFRVHGALATSRDGGVVDYRPTEPKARDRVALWVRHLVLACSPAGGGTSRWIGSARELTLGPVAAPHALLSNLLHLYWDGVCRPLPFFPTPAHRACTTKGDPLGVARAAWRPATVPGLPPSDSQDAYNALAFRGRDPIDEEFLRIAHQVFDALLAHETEVKG
jgi:exodeoxyribonuclease V gamma subunit